MNKKVLLYCYIVMLLFGIPVLGLAQGDGKEGYYKAIKVDQSYTGTVYLDPGKAMTFWVKYKNTGIYRWRNSGARAVYLKVDDASGTTGKFRQQFWKNKDKVAVLEKWTEPGEYATIKFALQAPKEIGEYQVKLRLWVYGDWLEAEPIEIPIAVGWEEIIKKREAERAKALGVSTEEAGYAAGDLQYPEPNIRVGLYAIKEEEGSKVLIKSSGAYNIYGADGQLYLNLTLSDKAEIEFNFKDKLYAVNVNGTRAVMSGKNFIFKSDDPNNVFTIENYSNPAYAGSEINYNQFRGSLEAVFIEENGKFWVVDELAMEQYLKGTGEAMDVSPYEFLKAMAVAERTYAMYNFLNPTKHKIRNFTVTASEGDQIYQGYAREIRQPNIARAVEETRGLIVTYGNAVALTPYYSQSDGRTRSYEEVWRRKDYPYLVSVPDQYMQGKNMIGHGVGMSARGALFKASRDGAKFDELIRHYYTGVEIKKIY